MLTSIAFIVFFAASPLPQSEWEIDPDLCLWSAGGVYLRPVNDVGIGEYVTCRVSFETKTKKARFLWIAKGSAQHPGTTVLESESMTYYPTGSCRSVDCRRSFYVVGRNGLTLTLERWTIDESVSVNGISTLSGPVTVFSPPTIQRVAVPIDSSIQNVCAISVNPGKSPEDVLVMEYETRNVYSLDPLSGAKTLFLPSSEVGAFRRMWLNRHSTYGACLMFSRIPSGVNMLRISPEPNYFIKYDIDIDGAFEGTFVLPFDESEEDLHPIRTDGDWVSWWPYEERG